MYDIHHHLLYGLDDGSPDIETSVEMAKLSASQGVTHIACSPHASYTYTFRPEENRDRLDRLRERLRGECEIELGLACDFHLSVDNIEDALAHPAKYTVNGKNYLLVEFPDFSIPPTINDVFFRLQIAGLMLILTHPERNPTIVRHPELLRTWVRNGCLVQVTAASLTGRFGKTAQSFSEWLLDRRWIHILATDAHNTTSRPPNLREAYDYVAERKGEAEAERLCVTNPKAAWEGAAVPQQPELIDLWEETPLRLGRESSHSGHKRGFFARLFGG